MMWEHAAFLGAVGGVLPDVFKTIRKRFEKRPAYLTSWFYWASFAVLGIAGAGVSVWRDPKDVVEAISYGAASIVFIQAAFGMSEDKHLGVTENVGLVTRIRLWWGS
jgi:hypothetical protein